MYFLSEQLKVKEALASATKEIAVNDTAIDYESAAIDIMDCFHKDMALLVKSKVNKVSGATTFTTVVSISHCDTEAGQFEEVNNIVFKNEPAVLDTETFNLIGVKADELKRYIKVKVSVNGKDGDTSIVAADILYM